MKKLIVAPLFLMLAGLPLVSWAGTESGLYIGGSIGQTSVEADFGDGVNKIDDEDNGYKILFGYNFGVLPLLDLGIEADYREYGEFGGDGVSTELVSSELFGVIGLNLGPVGLFGKVGYSDTDVDVDTGFDNLNFKDSESATAYGVGAKLSFGSFGLRAEYEVLDLDNVDDLNMISVGATYTF